MKNEMLDQWMQMNRSAMEPMMKLNEIAAQAFDKMTHHNLTLARDYMELSARQLQLFGEAKDPQKWASEEGRLVAEFGQKMVDRAEEILRLAKETQEMVSSWAAKAAQAGVDAVNK